MAGVYESNSQLIDVALRQMGEGTISYRIFQPAGRMRWDTIAYAFWTNPWVYELLMRANPHLIGRVWVDENDRLKVPEIESRPWIDLNALPPWDERRRQLGQ